MTRVANPHGDTGTIDWVNQGRVAVRFDDQSWNVWRAEDITVLCPSCDEPKDVADSTWQQWQCSCCSSWNDTNRAI